MASPESLFNQFQAAQEGAALPSIDLAKAGAVIKSPEEIRREWLKFRLGKFTASEFHRLMTCQGKNELPKGGKTYAAEKAIELLTDFEPDSYVSPAMQFGIDQEPEAVKAFMDKTGLEVVAHGDGQVFLQLGPDIGGTPDGLIPSRQSGIEIKCPNSKNHIEYMDILGAQTLKEIAPEYYWQCQGLMLINDSDYWYFVSYDPRFKNEKLRIHIVKIYRDGIDIANLRTRLDMAIQYRNEILEKLK